MALQIKWTKNALEDYNKVVEYLIAEWPVTIAEKFVETVQTRLERLAHYPHLGIVSVKQPAIRSISISKHNRLYYRITSEVIEILNIFDTRQNPGKNKYV